MLNKLNNTRAIAVATLTAICMSAGLARADGSESSEIFVNVAYVPGENGDSLGYAPVDCNELREAARFNREMERSDGDASPNAPAAACRPDIFAESTVDAD